ncbi:hypothetical protein ILT44_04385 [Microvirga sp. BT689]|uniref:hypothetical protein n=1 Tax=Microvirga arvi TaxID=2778731 RepID=UPI00194F0ADA|nr:hypothetical protein [Microvirga arvi]MBM6579412.1 hypothetical protein [Microvirga arvi]
MINYGMLDEVLQVLEAMDDDELLAEQARLRRQEGTEAADERDALMLYNTYYVCLERISGYFKRLYGLENNDYDEDREYNIAVPQQEAKQLMEQIGKLLQVGPTQEICQYEYWLEWLLFEQMQGELV